MDWLCSLPQSCFNVTDLGATVFADPRQRCLLKIAIRSAAQASSPPGQYPSCAGVTAAIFPSRTPTAIPRGGRAPTHTRSQLCEETTAERYSRQVLTIPDSNLLSSQ